MLKEFVIKFQYQLKYTDSFESWLKTTLNSKLTIKTHGFMKQKYKKILYLNGLNDRSNKIHQNNQMFSTRGDGFLRSFQLQKEDEITKNGIIYFDNFWLKAHFSGYLNDFRNFPLEFLQLKEESRRTKTSATYVKLISCNIRPSYNRN